MKLQGYKVIYGSSLVYIGIRLKDLSEQYPSVPGQEWVSFTLPAIVIIGGIAIIVSGVESWVRAILAAVSSTQETIKKEPHD